MNKRSGMARRLIFLLFAYLRLVESMYLVYLNGQHNIIPEKDLVSDISHVILAFMSPGTFNQEKKPSSWPLFTTVAETRSKFPDGRIVMVAIGGWGDTEGFSVAAATKKSREIFSRNVKAMIEDTGADGVDIDWEYPGGNGEDYKKNPNSAKAWEIDAYPQLLATLRSTLGPRDFISAAVPGLPRDMMAFNADKIPQITQSVDFFNIMTYDMMNRRDNATKHHAGIELSLNSINTYAKNGMPTGKMNLGFSFYLRWFKTDPRGSCKTNPIGCETVLMEDPKTGEDLGKSGAFSWHDPVPEELKGSFTRAMTQGRYDTRRGGHYYWDEMEDLWWTWETPRAIKKKSVEIMQKHNLSGVFAWALGEDGTNFLHLKALTASIKKPLREYHYEEL